MSSTVHSKVAPAEPMHRASLPVLRTVASFELAKGMIVLLAACGVLLLIRREDPWDIADSLLKLLHISPDHHFAQVFLDWADALTESKIWTIAAAAVSYSVLRFVEAYGLWNARAWAEWIALISGTIYLPFEIYKVIYRQNLFHISVLLINLAIVLYMVYELKTEDSLHRIREST
jgi:uncharacterized membrane protein (DUF2068 family)